MRVKTFTAESTVAAMDLVHDELGDKAIIIATRTERNGMICITAAVDPTPATKEDFEPHEPLALPSETEATVRQVLTYHGVPTWLSNRLAKATAEIVRPTILQPFDFQMSAEQHHELTSRGRADRYHSSRTRAGISLFLNLKEFRWDLNKS